MGRGGMLGCPGCGHGTEILGLEMDSWHFSKLSQLLMGVFWEVSFNTKKRGQLHCSSCRALPSFIIIAFQKFCAWETS